MKLPTEKFTELSPDLFVRSDLIEQFAKAGLVTMDNFFSYTGGQRLDKKNLASHRDRIRFALDQNGPEFFLKRYNNPPLRWQLKNWCMHKRHISTAACDILPGLELEHVSIQTPAVAAFGQQFSAGLEKRSFVITEKLPNADSLERALPECFNPNRCDIESIHHRRSFIKMLADFVTRFHATGFRHRDLYLCHIFFAAPDTLFLIDLARCFKPLFTAERYRLKDLSQLYYSAPAGKVTATDRLRFYKAMTATQKLDNRDKMLIRRIIRKAKAMAKHDKKHGRPTPFLNGLPQ